MKHAIRTTIAFAFASLCLCSGAGAKIVTFEIPPYATAIWPVAMNGEGQVTGWVDDGRTGAIEGFLWQRAGGFRTFAMPGAVTRGYVFPSGITDDGVITGSYTESRLDSGGFVRATDGSFKTFSLGSLTNPIGANKKGWIVGSYMPNQGGSLRSFLRDPSGATVEISVPHANEDAYATVVNRSRAIAGYIYSVSGGGERGFFQPAHGTAALFGRTHYNVAVSGINDAGTIAGYYSDSIQGKSVTTAFVRTADGTLTTFAGPNGATDTEAKAINNSGTIAGTFVDSTGTHGFFRTADGTITPFDLKGFDGTDIRAINDNGAIAGRVWIGNQKYGFAGKP